MTTLGKILCLMSFASFDSTLELPPLIEISRRGMPVLMISSRLSYLRRGRGKLPEFDAVGGLRVIRAYNGWIEQELFGALKYREILGIAKSFQPDVVFCFHQTNSIVATRLKADLNIPIVLATEFLSDLLLWDGRSPIRIPLDIWNGALLRQHVPIVGYWNWLQNNVSQFVSFFAGDSKYAAATPDRVAYVPQCIEPWGEVPFVPKSYGRGIYVGSFNSYKNTHEFIETIPEIFETTPTQEFILIGDGDTSFISKLSERYGDKIVYYRYLPRQKTLALVQSSYYGYSPTLKGGWGFIGDCWMMKTPLVSRWKSEQLESGSDSMVVETAGAVAHAVRRLYQDADLYAKIQSGGFTRYLRDQTCTAVVDRWLQVLNRAVSHNIQASKTR